MDGLKHLLTQIEKLMKDVDSHQARFTNPDVRYELSKCHVSLLQAAASVRLVMIWLGRNRT